MAYNENYDTASPGMVTPVLPISHIFPYQSDGMVTTEYSGVLNQTSDNLLVLDIKFDGTQHMQILLLLGAYKGRFGIYVRNRGHDYDYRYIEVALSIAHRCGI